MKQKNKEGYKLPDNFFKEFKKELIQKIDVPSYVPKIIPFNGRFLAACIMAASFLLLLVLLPSNVDEISSEDLISYIEEKGVDHWDIDMLIEEIDESSFASPLEEEFTDYIEETDLETIIEEL